MKHLLIPSLSNLIQPGLYSITDKNRNIFVGYSTNILQSVSRQLTMIKDNIHPLQSCEEVQVIEFTDKYLKEKQTYYVEQFKAQGYQVVNTNRLLKYHTRIRIDKNYQVLVEVVPKNKKSIIVGVFSNVLEAQHYCNYLNTFDPIVPLIASNDLTLKYMKDNRNRRF
jgi:hypothetical protein